MLRRLLGTVLIVLGLVSAGLGVASATVWRPSDAVVATAKPVGDGTLVVTDPGVLELVGSDVTISATVPDKGKVTLAVGRDVDVDGWVGIDHSTRVHGLSDWTTLDATADVPEIPKPAEGQQPAKPGTGANPAGNDMWVAQESGEGTVQLRWNDRPGRWSLIAAGVGGGATAPTLTLTWPREVTNAWLWPGVGAGVVLVAAGVLVLVLRRKGRAAPAQGPRGDGGAPDGDAVKTPVAMGGVFGTLTAPGATPAAAEPSADAAESDATEPDATEPRPSTAALPTRSALRTSRRARREAAEADAAVPVADVAAPEAAAPVAGDVAAQAQPPAAAPRSPMPMRWAAFGRTPDPAPAPAPAPESAPEPQPAAEAPAEPPTATGAIRMTRREMRAQEEARRAAEQTGITGRLRALTGSIPVVRPGQPPAPDPDDPPTRASRSQAWRQAWGFDPDAAQNDRNDAEGGAR
ncbi:MAG: hypothetical protein FWF90_14510 [Promicromonosporaceae bacterium]|nr:hypothetical protein [Promicromonosporaceae bacterium]